MPKIGDYVISLAGTLPGERRCGLAEIYGELIKHPDAIRFAVIAFDVQHIKVPTDPGDQAEPTLRIKRWEVAEGDDAQAVLNLIDAINGRREGSDAEQPTLATTAELGTAAGDGGQGEDGEGEDGEGGEGEGGPLGGWPAAAEDGTLRGEG
jgi:hypothetical protein